MPTVSVILTSYNHAKYLRDSIESVLNQTFTDFELIIGDDASTDESWEIIQSCTDPRIRAYRHEKQQGGGIINELVVAGKLSDLIAIQHSDDIWEPQKLEKQVAFLDEHPDVGAVFSHAFIIDENSEPFEDTSHYYYNIFDQPNRNRHEWLNFFFYHGNALCHPSILIRRRCYDEEGVYRYGLAQIGDLDMWIRLCLKYEIHVLPEKLVRFRVRAHEANDSGNRPETRLRSYFEFFQVFRNYCAINSWDEFNKVFPMAGKYYSPDGFESDFVLGMIALETHTLQSVNLLGLNLIFEAINDPVRAEKIVELYDFHHMDFLALTARFDLFSTELVAALSRQVKELMAQVHELRIKEQELSAIHSSTAWKWANTLWQIRLFLLPLKSTRERIFYWLWRRVYKP